MNDIMYRVEYADPNGDLKHKEFATLANTERFCDRLEHRMIDDRCDGYEIQEVRVIKDRWI